MKRIQRHLLRTILARAPPAACAHGFVEGRSVHTFVAPHVGRRVVLRLDLEDFFASIHGGRVRAIFARLGYPERVARKLAGLVCVATPEDVLRQLCAREGAASALRLQRLRGTLLPQGAPTSPALANLVAYRLDRRLSRLAEVAGARYTRYADDLAFSGPTSFERCLARFVPRVGAIVLEEGFSVQHRKTRVMRAAARQHLCGLVVNARPNVRRDEYDALRALLHNAIRSGPESQNRGDVPDFRAHVCGRVAWVAATNPARGLRLARMLERIAW